MKQYVIFLSRKGMDMENTVKESVRGMDRRRRKLFKWTKRWTLITASIIGIFVLIFGGLSYYQSTHFNKNITINGVHVGGMTAEEALEALKSTQLKNDVYIGEELIVNGTNTKMGFTNEDLADVKNILNEQKSFLPSPNKNNYSLVPGNLESDHTQEIATELEQKLTEMNKDLKAPQDATVSLQNREIVISESAEGEQLDVASLLNEFEKQGFSSEVHLEPIYTQPIHEDSEVIKNGAKKLQALLDHTVEYKVQDQTYTLNGNQLIENATVTKDLEVTVEPAEIQAKIDEINQNQATLDKDFTFKTHSGSVITVPGKGYGWALDVEKETEAIQAAFEGEESLTSASNISGHGWEGEGYGYETVANNGIGDTYAELSISEQRVWIYKDGEMVFTTNVVTGNHSSGEDTLKGVWYVLFKRTDYVLTGQRSGAPSGYAQPVNYWIPFTNSGQGFHDAAWRTNWSSSAYLNNGSGGCVNIKPELMKQVYDNIDVYTPIVIY